MEKRIKQLEEAIQSIYSQSKDGVMTDRWIGWKAIAEFVDLVPSKDPDKCPHCGSNDVSYLNHKHHLYMYCVDSNLTRESDEKATKATVKYVKEIRDGKHKQFIWNKEKEKVTCRCGHAAVFMKNEFVCGTITAYPCKYN
jgi:hypothetical protein